jgi:hypothetical protein
MAILNATFLFPPTPVYSARLKNFIGLMLEKDPIKRFDIFQVFQEVCYLRNVPCRLNMTPRTNANIGMAEQVGGNVEVPGGPFMAVNAVKSASPFEKQVSIPMSQSQNGMIPGGSIYSIPPMLGSNFVSTASFENTGTQFVQAPTGNVFSSNAPDQLAVNNPPGPAMRRGRPEKNTHTISSQVDMVKMGSLRSFQSTSGRLEFYCRY